MTISQCVSNRIRDILHQKNITIYKLEQISDLNRGTITTLLYNRNNSVNLKTLLRIIKSLGISILEFFDDPIFDYSCLEIN